MKRLRFVAALLVLGFGASPCCVRANSDHDARKAIQLRYDQFNTSYMKKDFKAVSGIFSPKCSMKLAGEGRTMAVAKVLSGMEAISKSLTVSHAKTQILSIQKSSDGRYSVESVWTATSDYAPVNHSKEDPARHSTAKQMYKDTWEKTCSGWQITKRLIRDVDNDANAKLHK